ncbi:hypothetical protein H4219_005501 [Mycoemilia scoparia]|uniref:Tr-type G domain-containing protein n=1 Tax=Mycoemilia scoparia TaxID=417184 RepID=A0A9W7ZP09_9FUNG|nr:hypothetical protein H4219_005501 [Mycoemilia scoparia]
MTLSDTITKDISRLKIANTTTSNDGSAKTGENQLSNTTNYTGRNGTNEPPATNGNKASDNTAPRIDLESLLSDALIKDTPTKSNDIDQDHHDFHIRTLKEQLIDPTPLEEQELIERIARDIEEGFGETLFEVGKEDDGTTMSLSDLDIGKITQTLTRITTAKDSRIDATCQLLFDRGCPGDKPAIHAQTTTTTSAISSLSESSTSTTFSAKATTKSKSKRNGSATTAAAAPAACSETLRRRVYYLIRKKPSNVNELLEVRVAVAGNVDAGKSTLLGVLTKGQLDDGRGRARVNMFRHKHEIETGRTSSIGLEILGFDKETCMPIISSSSSSSSYNNSNGVSAAAGVGNTTAVSSATSNISHNRKMSWIDICSKASKIISFSDLAGHEKYLKTTVFGLTSNAPECMLLMVGANAGIIGMTKEHLGLALALNVPVMIIVSKIDMCPENILAHTLKQLDRILRSSGCRKHPIFVHNSEDVITTSRYFHSGRICPIFQVSNISGEGIDYLTMFLNLLPISNGGGGSNFKNNNNNDNSGGGKAEKNGSNNYYSKSGTTTANTIASSSFMFEINETFSVPFVGTVVSGIVRSGIIHSGDNVWIGPDSLGQFWDTTIKTIQRKRVNTSVAYSGQSVSFSLKRVKRAQVRKGMVLLGKTIDVKDENSPTADTNGKDGTIKTIPAPTPISYKMYEAEILVLFHSTTICNKYQAMMHCNSVRQTARIISIDTSDQTLRTGDRAVIKLRFISYPEYLLPGSRFIFREGRTRAVGKILRPIDPKEERDIIRRITNGTMVLEGSREAKSKAEAIRHQHH